jgi:hypothetical protein
MSTPALIDALTVAIQDEYHAQASLNNHLPAFNACRSPQRGSAPNTTGCGYTPALRP